VNFSIPRIIDCTLTEAIANGCDCVMLKHDGFPVTINCAAGACNIIADFGDKREQIDTIQLIEPLDGLFVGAKSRFNPVIHLYDCWWINGQDVQHSSYRERYVLTRMNARKLDERFVVVQAVPIQAAHELWKQVIADPDRVKGLVFRRSKDTAAGDLYVKRYYKEKPEGLE
jgi:hypothetical protein